MPCHIPGNKGGNSPGASKQRSRATQTICDRSEAGDHQAVLAKWNEVRAEAGVPSLQLVALEAVAEALTVCEPTSLRSTCPFIL